jgi:hypothetical protein
MNRSLLPRLLTCCALAAVTLGFAAWTLTHTLARYHEMRLGWSWDLAYYNQWLWAFTRGDGQITVRPIASYAVEGPSIWKMNYLSPIRFALALMYRFLPEPDPRFLLAVAALLFCLITPAVYTLARSEGCPRIPALAAAIAALFAPAIGTLAQNDYRELQIAIPFLIWAVQAWRSRNAPRLMAAIAALFATRQEWAIAVASLIIVPPRRPEDAGTTLRWRIVVLAASLFWFLGAFFGYLVLTIGWSGPEQYLAQFAGPKAPWIETLDTGFDFAWVSLGAWLILALGSPRVALLMLPWIYSQASGRWTLRLVGTEQWHHIRYTAPFVAFGLAAGTIGWARFTRLLLPNNTTQVLTRPVLVRIGIACLLLAFLSHFHKLAWTEMHQRLARIPHPVPLKEIPQLWFWINQVQPDDGVLAAYELSAPLSSRRFLYSDVLDLNKPRGFPAEIPQTVHWLFSPKPVQDLKVFYDQGFELVHQTANHSVWRRKSTRSHESPKKFE